MVYDVHDFDAEVIQRSYTQPVLVDFWAEWCMPCKMLSPILERLASQQESRWVLAKVDTEEHPQVASQFDVRGIPNVKLFVDGKAIAEFTGALPEYAVSQWLTRVLPSKSRASIERAREFIAAGDLAGARELLAEANLSDPDDQEVSVLLAQTLVFSDRPRASSLVERVDEPKHSELADAIRTLLHLLDVVDHPELLPDSHAKSLYWSAASDVKLKNFDSALGKFIDVIRTDRFFDDDGARKACIAIFKYLGEEHPITQKHRRQFGSALYV
jgi:putative thioredoxin